MYEVIVCVFCATYAIAIDDKINWQCIYATTDYDLCMLVCIIGWSNKTYNKN